MQVPVGVILAGGQARRMGGGDKGLLMLGDCSLMARVTRRIGAQVDRTAINANGDPARFSEFELPVIADSVGGFAGPLAGVLAGLDWAHGQRTEHIVTVAADTPFFPDDLVVRLMAAARSGPEPIIFAATHDPERGLQRQPTFGLWPVSLRDDLRASLDQGVRKVVQWANRHGATEVVFDTPGRDPFFNVNTPADLTLARALLQDERT